MAKNEGFTTNIYSRFGWAQLFVASLICILFYSCSSDQLSNDELPEGIKDTWVAVFPFENKTGTSELDALGEMVADWVMQGLIETNEGKLISSSRVKSIISQAKDLDIEPNDFISREQNVHYLIEGSYYRVDSTLMFASNIKNIYTGEVVFAFPVIEGTEQDVMSLIEGLKQRILGYWVTKDLKDYQRKPPNYGAYQAFLAGTKIFDVEPYKARILLEQSTKLDTNFHLATIWYARILNKLNQVEKADSIRLSLQKIQSHLSPTELMAFRFFEAIMTNNQNLFWRQLQTSEKPFYISDAYWHWYNANGLMSYYNQNEKALEYFQNIDFTNLDYKLAENGWLYFLHAICRYKNGEYEQAIKMAANTPFEMSFQNNWSPLVLFQLELLAKMSAYEELDKTLDYYQNSHPSVAPFSMDYLRFHAIRAMFSNDHEKASEYARNYLRFIQEGNHDTPFDGILQNRDEIVSELYLALREPDKITSIIQNKLDTDLYNREALTLKGIYHAQMNEPNKSKEVLASLYEINDKKDSGETEYSAAIIQAWLGNKQQVTILLNEAYEKGKAFHFDNFDGDWRLSPLYDDPAFIEEVLSPKPLPEVELSPDHTINRPNHYWKYLIGSLVLAVLIYLVLNKTKQNNQVSATPIEPTDLAVIEVENEFLVKLNTIVQDQMSNVDLNMPQICKAIGMSRTQVYRKVKALTGKSPSIYIRSIKLQKAKTLLKDSHLNISEIGYEVGFKDLSYFSRSFAEEYGISPSEMRKDLKG